MDLRIDARWIVPVEPSGALDAHALVVDAGRIVAIVPAVVADRDYAPRTHLAFPRHALMPGLVNAHTHSAMTLFRGIADDLPLKAWLEDHIWPREMRFLSAEFVRDGTLLAAAEMLRGGITCCNDMYFHSDAAAEAYEQAGMRAMLGIPVLDFATPYAPDADGYLQRGLAARDALKHSPRLSFSLAPHAPYTVGDSTWRKVVMFARQLDLIIQTHVAETKSEVDDARAASGETPLARLDRLGATGPGFIAIHAVHLSAAEIELLSVQRSHVVHCPGSNLKLASGIAPVSDLVAHGINVALGTDGAASNNRLDMFSEMRLASLVGKAATGDAAALDAETVVRMATLGGATALGLEDRIGTLVAGKDADIVAVDLAAIETQPLYDPVSHLVNAAGREHVTDVWIAGERVVDARRPVRIDVDRLFSNVEAWRSRLA